MRQASFDFPHLDHYLDDDFLLSNSNLKAFNFVSNFDLENKTLPKVFAIFGKKSCGKTHLSHIWQRKVNATYLELDKLQDSELAHHIEENQNYIIEDIEEIENQVNLFHSFNIITEKNCNLMLTCGKNLNQIEYKFADLESRLKNVFAIEIGDPEIDFIKMLLIKEFSSKQLLIEDKVIDYLAKNIDRSYENIFQVCRLLEIYCFEQKRKITIPFVGNILEAMKFEQDT